MPLFSLNSSTDLPLLLLPFPKDKFGTFVLFGMRTYLLLLFIFEAIVSNAQPLTGIWRGKRTQVAGGCFPEYSTEIHIYYDNGKELMGNAYNYYSRDQYTKINFKGRYNASTKRLVLIENAVVQYQVPPQCTPCIKTYDLNWIDSAQPILDGEWKGHEMGSSNICPPGKIHLLREAHALFPVDVYQNDSLALLEKGLRLSKRDRELVREIRMSVAEAKIELYDNAEIDGDTVTILLNDRLLLYKRQLTDKPLVIPVTLMPNTDYEFVMYADNLGSIPPNTSLMIITAGSQRYEVRISSSQEKSAMIRLRYDK